MLRELADQYTHEDSDLAAYATHNSQSRGRRFPERSHPFRTNFQRDRDRILHSRSFRRLEYKTQVFLNGTGDHLRTRLTHTIEVAAICRTIARALRLNEDLSETIALAHDLGHTPFGHAGERMMNRLMKEHGGFDHNLQALRVVDTLEIKYPSYDGLNLSWEVRSGLMKHRGPEKTFLDGIELPPQPSLESQTADLGDDLTYYGHDVDDGLDSELITEEMLASIDIWNLAAEKARENNPGMEGERFRAFTVRCLIDMMVGDAIRHSHKLLKSLNINSQEDICKAGQKLISFSPEFEKMTLQLREFLYKNLYFHRELQEVNDAACDKIKTLFEKYVTDPGLMGHSAQSRIKHDGIHRAATDYIAGMTDRFAYQEYERLCK